MNNNKKSERRVRWSPSKSSVKDMSINIDVGDKFRELMRQQKDNTSLLEARIERNRRQREERERVQRQKEDQEVEALRERERQKVLKAQEMIRQKGLKELKKQQQKEVRGKARQEAKDLARLNKARERETNQWMTELAKEGERRVRFMDRLHTKKTRARERVEFKKWHKARLAFLHAKTLV